MANRHYFARSSCLPKERQTMSSTTKEGGDGDGGDEVIVAALDIGSGTAQE